MPNKKINQLDVRVGGSLNDLSLVGDAASGTSFKLTLNQISTIMGVPGKFAQPTGSTAQYLRGDGSLATFPFSGGASGDILIKNSSTNYDTGWTSIIDLGTW